MSCLKVLNKFNPQFMERNIALFNYLLRLGDHSLILGQRLSEWCSKGPLLEEDLAMTNMALDHIGRAAALYKYAAEVEGKGQTEDDLAYRRGERAFLNPLLVELPRGDFAFTMLRQYLCAVFEYYLYQALTTSKNETIAGISAKAVKEARYHMVHARDWCLRLGLGTAESKRRLKDALNAIWMYTGDLFEMYDEDALLVSQGIGVDLNEIKAQWEKDIFELFQKVGLSVPNVDYMQTGSRNGIHTEHLGHLLAEMQYLQRAYPDAKW